TKAQQSIGAFVAFVDQTRVPLHHASTSAQPLQTWADHFLNQAGYFAELKRLEKNPENAEARIHNLRELMATMDDAGRPTDLLADRLQTFLEEITLDTEREEEAEASDAVTLITMHSCKGLEFPRVFVVGLEEGLLPHARSAAGGTLDEERRLLYVALTRAMQSLTLSYCAGRKRYGQLMPCHPSRFLKELPPELVEDALDKRPVDPDAGRKMFEILRGAVA
ncbi:MAG: ATP-dependent helicase, partial [Verrucomicrobiota bacterium]